MNYDDYVTGAKALDTSERFRTSILKSENQHILGLVVLVYKLLQLMVKSNFKIGTYVFKWVHIFLAQVTQFFEVFLT